MPECVYLSRRRVEASEWSFTATVDGAGPIVMNIPAGDYYLDSATSSESLVDQIDLALTTAFGAENFIITVEETRLDGYFGFMRFNCTTLAGNWTITFDQEAFANWVGFAGVGGGFAPTATAAVYGDYMCQGLIVTDCRRNGFKRWKPRYATNVRRSQSGPPSFASNASTIKAADWSHDHEPEGYVASPRASGCRDLAGTVLPWSWEDFFDHHAGGAQCGQPWRIWDEDPGAGWTGYEKEAVILNIKDFDYDWQEPHSAEYWKIRIDAEEYQGT